MGFKPLYYDPDVWLTKKPHRYDYIATHIDNMMIVVNDTKLYIKMLTEFFTL